MELADVTTDDIDSLLDKLGDDLDAEQRETLVLMQEMIAIRNMVAAATERALAVFRAQYQLATGTAGTDEGAEHDLLELSQKFLRDLAATIDSNLATLE